MSSAARIVATLVGVALAGPASAQVGPDLTVLRLAMDGDEFLYHGQAGGIAAYSFGATACNPGTEPVHWSTADHPVFGQNFFRLRDGRFEHLGQSWVRHGFCAVNELGCGACQATPCSTLGIGCASTNFNNDGAFGGPKSEIDATTGLHPDPYPGPSGPGAIAGRLQVHLADIDPALNPGARYFAEAQYVSAHDAGAGNAANNASWREIDVVAVEDVDGLGPTQAGEPAVVAWRAADSAVEIVAVVNPDEGGPGVHGHYVVGYRSTALGSGLWRYDYAIQNLSSAQSGASFALPVPTGLDVDESWFHDVDYHSGEPFDGTDWSFSQSVGEIGWACTETYERNPDANALRWGTLYTFGVTCDAPPQSVPAELALFAPGPGDVLVFEVAGPGTAPPVGTPFCFGDGSGGSCPCANPGGPAAGCANSTGGGGQLAGSGSNGASADDLVLAAEALVPAQPALLFVGEDPLGGGDGVPFGDGLRCVGTGVVRLGVHTPDAAGSATWGPGLGASGGWSAGDTRYFQVWYRDPGGPCDTGFNLTNGTEVSFEP